MPNPFLPLWEYIPDGEPRVFGDRVYIYGSHDRANSDSFCDHILKVWSAPLNDLNSWQCHGVSFSTSDPDYIKATDESAPDKFLYAPDVVEKDGKYYLYMYVFYARGIVAESGRPEGPFKLISHYKARKEDEGDDGVFNDPGVLVDDDGRVYIYYGFERSHFNEINPDNMIEIKEGSLKLHMVGDRDDEAKFFEASSIRKIGDLYYFIYSPKRGCRLAYATSKRPEGPFEYRGYIIDNGIDYPGGNDHGSIANINGQWYVFYHRMTNKTILSRRACVEKITILPDGTIPTVEMTSLGFEDSLNPYRITPAEIACVLKKDAFITERDKFTRTVSNIKNGCVIGYKYFDFGEDFSSESMILSLKVFGTGCSSRVRVMLDDCENGEEVGVISVDTHDGIYSGRLKNVTGRHALYFKVEYTYQGDFAGDFDDRSLFDLESFVFQK